MKRLFPRRAWLAAALLAFLFGAPAARAQTDAETLPGEAVAEAGSGEADATDTSEIRATLQAYLDAIDSLRADFRSVLLDERKIPVAESSGVLMIKRPHRFRWEYREPSPSLILADGEKLWSYDADLEQAVVRRMDEIEGANPSSLLSSDARLEEDFDVLGAYHSGDVEWVDLRPQGQSDFTRVRLGFDDGVISLMELHDQLGQITQIALSGVDDTPDLDDGLFRFEPPPGTDIVGAD